MALPLSAQKLAPRAFWPAPAGTNVVSFGYSYQSGDVVTDPSVPVEDARAESHALQGGYLRFFDLAGRTASIAIELPYVEARYTGRVEGEEARRTLAGISDARMRLAVNLRGAPAMTPEEFRLFAADPEPVLGLSLEVQTQTGQYDPNRLLNLGSNRWAVKPEAGYLRRLRPRWIVEAALGAWFFTANKDFQGQQREQDPLGAAELHLVWSLPSGTWASLDLNFYAGGRTQVDGVDNDDRQQNSRYGATLLFPLGGRQAIRVAASSSLTTKSGGDYHSFILAYQKVWR